MNLDETAQEKCLAEYSPALPTQRGPIPGLFSSGSLPCATSLLSLSPVSLPPPPAPRGVFLLSFQDLALLPRLLCHASHAAI